MLAVHQARSGGGTASSPVHAVVFMTRGACDLLPLPCPVARRHDSLDEDPFELPEEGWMHENTLRKLCDLEDIFSNECWQSLDMAELQQWRVSEETLVRRIRACQQEQSTVQSRVSRQVFRQQHHRQMMQTARALLHERRAAQQQRQDDDDYDDDEVAAAAADEMEADEESFPEDHSATSDYALLFIFTRLLTETSKDCVSRWMSLMSHADQLQAQQASTASPALFAWWSGHSTSPRTGALLANQEPYVSTCVRFESVMQMMLYAASSHNDEVLHGGPMRLDRLVYSFSLLQRCAWLELQLWRTRLGVNRLPYECSEAGVFLVGRVLLLRVQQASLVRVYERLVVQRFRHHAVAFLSAEQQRDYERLAQQAMWMLHVLRSVQHDVHECTASDTLAAVRAQYQRLLESTERWVLVSRAALVLSVSELCSSRGHMTQRLRDWVDEMIAVIETVTERRFGHAVKRPTVTERVRQQQRKQERSGGGGGGGVDMLQEDRVDLYRSPNYIMPLLTHMMQTLHDKSTVLQTAAVSYTAYQSDSSSSGSGGNTSLWYVFYRELRLRPVHAFEQELFGQSHPERAACPVYQERFWRWKE